MRNVKQDLANLSQKKVSDIRMSRLMKFSGAARKQRELEATYGTELNLNIPQVERVKNLVSQALEEEADEINGALPVISVFDALQHVKSQKDLQKDAGLRTLYGHLQRMWDNSLEERGPSDITAASFMTLKDHYARNYPKSRAANVIDGFGRKGYSSLNRSDLTRLASEIETQEDFERVVIENGLQGRAPNQVKARKFILACVNSQEEEVMRPFDRRAQMSEDDKYKTITEMRRALSDVGLYYAESVARSSVLQAIDENEDADEWVMIQGFKDMMTHLDESNMEATLAELQEADPQNIRDIQGEYAVKALDENGDLTRAGEVLTEIISALSDYPVLSDEDLAQREHEETLENIESEGSSIVDDDLAPEDWPRQVFSWLWDNNQEALDYRTETGGYYPDEDAIKEALRSLGWLFDDEDEEEY